MIGVGNVMRRERERERKKEREREREREFIDFLLFRLKKYTKIVTCT
jgi:hypothetical protein